MSTVRAIPRPVIIPREFEEQWETLRCSHCEKMVTIRADDPEPAVCDSCAEALAESSASRSLCEVRDLVRGVGWFSRMDCDRRRELLLEHGLEIEPWRNAADAPSPAERAAIELREEIEAMIDAWD